MSLSTDHHNDRLLGWTETLRGAIGILILLAVIALSERVFFTPGYYRSLDFHPFWVVVLLAALQHGLALGVATVVMATVLLGFPDRIIGEDATAYLARASVLPLRWLIVALVVGLIRQAQIRETAELKSTNERLTRTNDTLAREVERMDDIVMTLERQAVARDVSSAPVPATQAAPEPVAKPKKKPKKSVPPAFAPRPKKQATPSTETADTADATADPTWQSIQTEKPEALPLLAAFAQSTPQGLGKNFNAASAALLDVPAVFILVEDEDPPLVLGATERLAQVTDDPAALMFDFPIDEPRAMNHPLLGWIAVCHNLPTVEQDQDIAVIAFCDDEDTAKANRHSVGLLADTGLACYERLWHEIAEGPSE